MKLYKLSYRKHRSSQLFATTSGVMIYFYAQIYFHIRRVFGKMANPKVQPAEETAGRKKKKKKSDGKEKKILMQFIVITMFFLSCWAVLAVSWVLSGFFGVVVYEPHIDGFVGFCCHLNSSANPIVYGAMNKSLRNAMLDIFPKWLRSRMYNMIYGKKVARAESLKSISTVEEDDSKASSEESQSPVPTQGRPLNVRG